jgi:hypothetical protein
MKLGTCSKKTLLGALTFAAATAYSPLAHGAVISQSLGGVDFTDGQTVATGTFNSTNAGEPAPFNAFNGADPSGPNFSASWTFSYGAIVGTVSSATLQIGLLDGDSAASGNQVASYTIGGIDITALLNTVMEATPGANSKENYYQITLPASTFSLLALGGPTVSLTL